MTPTDNTAGHPCGYCGQYHGPTCPMIKAIEYFPDGTVKRVEFKTPADYMPQVGPLFVPGPLTVRAEP